MSKTLIESLLGDTGNGAEWAEDKLNPEELTKMAEEPATVLWVVRFVRRVHSGCWVKSWVRSFRIWLAVGVGITLCVYTVGFFAIRSMLRESQRATVIQTLRELKVISATPSPATGESVAALIGGSP